MPQNWKTKASSISSPNWKTLGLNMKIKTLLASVLLMAGFAFGQGQFGGGGSSGGAGSGTVSANSGTAGANAYYAAAGGSTTVSPDANLIDNATNFLFAEGIVFSGVTGAATTISTSTTNASINILPNGTGQVFLNVGTGAVPTLVATGATNTGLVMLTSGECGDVTATFVGCFLNAGVEVGGSKSFVIGSSAGANSTQALGISAVVLNGNAFSLDTTTSGNQLGLLRAGNACYVTSAITLVASPTFTNICSWSLPAVAKTWGWQCSGTYNISAGTTPTLILGMNASQAPTSETGNGTIDSVSGGTTSQVTTANSATSSASGDVTIQTGASVTTVTSAPWTSSGTIQASATAGTFAIRASMGGTTPAGTISVGSVCWLQ
jgi:hypothetical protein